MISDVGSKENPIDLTEDDEEVFGFSREQPVDLTNDDDKEDDDDVYENRRLGLQTVTVDSEDTCCCCLAALVEGQTYYMAECGHLFCYQCMFDYKLLNRCGRCNQVFMSAVPVKIVVE